MSYFKEIVLQVLNSLGVETTVGYKTGEEFSIPSVLVDYGSPTTRAAVNGLVKNTLGLNTVNMFKSHGAYYPSIPEDFLVDGDTYPGIVNADGLQETRSAVLTDEGSFTENWAGATIDPLWTVVKGTGGNATVSGSTLTLASGTTANSETYVVRAIDYFPVRLYLDMALSQRIANQEFFIELTNNPDPALETAFARLRFSGTDNTKCFFESRSSTDGPLEGNGVALSIGSTAVDMDYILGLMLDSAIFSVGHDDVSREVIKIHNDEFPGPYDVLYVRLRVKNGATPPASNTNLTCAVLKITNANRVEITNTFRGDPIHSTITQIVTPDSGNSSVSNLAASATFTGEASSTLGVAGLQISLKTDQNCTVYVDQSPDGTNWDISDTYNYYTAKGGNAWTVQAVNSYFRVRVINTGASTTTYFRLQSSLCPIVEAVPRSLDSNGNLKTGINSILDSIGFEAFNSPTGSIRTAQTTKLVGADFEGTTIDTVFWTSTVANGGTNTQANSQMRLRTNTTSAGSAIIDSVRTSRYVAAQANYFRAVIVNDVATANNTRRWGAFSTTNGCFFQYNGTAFGIVTRKGSSDTVVANGSFNGDLGNTYAPGIVVHTYEIYWTNSKVWFVVDGNILHTVYATSTTWTDTLAFPIRLENTNGAITTDLSMYVRVVSINRLGPMNSDPIYTYMSGAGTTVCKIGPGFLHRLVITDGASGSTVRVWDNTAASGNTMAFIATASVTFPNSVEFMCPFSVGLTIVRVNAVNVTAIYE